jgi:hypothetical protein
MMQPADNNPPAHITSVEMVADGNSVADNPAVIYRSPETDASKPTVSRASLISADSATVSAMINPDTFFINKFPMDQLMQEFTQFANSKKDSTPLIHLWILKQIDHWNNDHEMVIGLSSNALYFMKFDFVIRKRRGDIQMVLLADITSLTRGEISYPAYSVMERNDHAALRIAWGDLNALPLTQRWNPLSRVIPYSIFASHPMFLVENNECDSQSRTRFDVNHFAGEVLQAIRGHNKSMQLEEAPILVSSYFSLTSLIFNQSHLGFSKDRNGVSF